jgi:uncharacterized repeat protein (TIGR01451 family)
VSLALVGGLVLLLLALSGMVAADPITPPAGYPKLALSVKTVSPTLAYVGGTTLTYQIEIRNTGAWTETEVALMDVLTGPITYISGTVAANTLPTPTVQSDTLAWQGDVGFDATALFTFSVRVDETFSGTLMNTAVLSQATTGLITMTAETIVTNQPIFVIEKRSEPLKPGANQLITYTLTVRNEGQPATDLPLTVTDYVPVSTTLYAIGDGGATSAVSDVVTWTQSITLGLLESQDFSFSVRVGDVASGTVIANALYQVDSAATEIVTGSPYTVTIVEPIFHLSKEVMPDPPGSNREMTYKLTLLNTGSRATDVVITDVVPSGVTYVGGGTMAQNVVQWETPTLDTGEVAEFTFTVSVPDVMGVPIVNDSYSACSAQDVCAAGEPQTSTVKGPVFEIDSWFDPIAKKPGGGSDSGPVTPTIVIRNLGPGSAIDARAVLTFRRVSIKTGDFLIDPDVGSFQQLAQGDKMAIFAWVGPLAYDEVITFTLKPGVGGVSTIGGEEGDVYSVTTVITDGFTNAVETSPVSDTATGKITHMAHLVSEKSAVSVIGRGQVLTYTIDVRNTALTGEAPPFPYIHDSIPSGTTFITASHGGVYRETTATLITRILSWTLPVLGTGEVLDEPLWFSVRVDEDLVSGTQIINECTTYWYESEVSGTGWLSSTSMPVTTTVVEVGLIDSYKAVTPKLVKPGKGNVLTYSLHIVNSSLLDLTGVKLYDRFPWEVSTYQRDAVASAAEALESDIVSLVWEGDVAAQSEEVITLTVLVDEDYRGPVSNTAVITHPDLLAPVEIDAVAYVADEPVLIIEKDGPKQVKVGAPIDYVITVQNHGQQATRVVVTDTLPAKTTLLTESISAPGEWIAADGIVKWQVPAVQAGASRSFKFSVMPSGEGTVINAAYGVTCDEGVSDTGPAWETLVGAGYHFIYLPIVMRNF